ELRTARGGADRRGAGPDGSWRARPLHRPAAARGHHRPARRRRARHRRPHAGHVHRLLDPRRAARRPPAGPRERRLLLARARRRGRTDRPTHLRGHRPPVRVPDRRIVGRGSGPEPRRRRV
ncbi:MAG: hypothetical protein AVDCRST_MAG79-3185, partial [uncultured Thermoleophilia bacterium]